MNEKTLFVDDDASILSAFKRFFKNELVFETASSGREALVILHDKGPFAVVVADMRMPEMNGIDFLSIVKDCYPETVRIMLTGNADMQTAIDAINEDNIFRFLSKPTSKQTIIATVNAAIEQYRLIMAEKELLEKTLRGSIEVLIEILGIVNPVAFAQSQRILRYIRFVEKQLELPNAWQLEIAALLSQIGCVSIPTDILEKLFTGEQLTLSEKNMYNSHPKLAAKLLSSIPRIDNIIKIIEFQDVSQQTGNEKLTEPIKISTQILNASIEIDRLLVSGLSLDKAIEKIDRKDLYQNAIIEAFELYNKQCSVENFVIKEVMIDELKTGMILDDDIKTTKGLLLAPKKQEMHYSFISRVKNFAKKVGVKEPIRVKIYQL